MTSSLHFSPLKTCLETAHNFMLSGEEAHAIFEKLTAAIERHWESVCEEAELSMVEQRLLWRRQFLNPFSLVGD